MNQALHQLGSLDEAADDTHLRLREECLVDLLHALGNLSFRRHLIAIESAEGQDFLLEEGSELRHATGQLGAQILEDLLPLLHALHMVHQRLLVSVA